MNPLTEALALFTSILIGLLLVAMLAAMAYYGLVYRDRAAMDRELDRMHDEAVRVSTQGVYADPKDAS